MVSALRKQFLSSFVRKAVLVKPLHFCLVLAVLTVSLPVSHAGLLGTRIKHSYRPQFFRPASEAKTVFRAQSDTVPLPPGVTPGVGSSAPVIPNSPGFGQPAMPSASVPGIPAGQTVQSRPILGDSYNTDPYGQGIVGSPQPSTWNAFSPPTYSDPFVGGPGGAPYAPYSGAAGVAPYGAGGFSTPGANGPAPYRMGWHTDLDIEWMPETSASGAGGNFEQFGVDYDLGYTGPFMPGWMMTWTNQFRLRNWDGPGGGAGLPGKAFRFGWDFELETPKTGPVSVKFGITPSINSDLADGLGRSAFQLDGRGMFIFQLDQYWSMVLGAGYWDRVDDRVIPYVGLVYRDDFWEWRIMYPETTVSLFLGNEAQWSKWMYMRAEYHVEAYEVTTSGGGRDQAELEDYRILLGFRMDAGTYSWFTEGGWVFDRNVDFGLPANGSFSPETGFIGRIGWRY